MEIYDQTPEQVTWKNEQDLFFFVVILFKTMTVDNLNQNLSPPPPPELVLPNSLSQLYYVRMKYS